ncbi:hypothetical protein [Sporosarcina psychrophila]|uniref:Membrane protein YqjE n=1 Tax=Sporosarcina psychrophila TaxID=1476 RepID=A0ABV2KB91_SPOPS
MNIFNSFTMQYSNLEDLPKILSGIFDLVKKYTELPNEFKNVMNFILFALLLFILTIGVRFIVRSLSIQAFDIKLHHKTEHSRLQVSKFVAQLIISTAFLVYLQIMLAIVSNEIQIFKSIYLAGILFIMIFLLLFVLNIAALEILVIFYVNIKQNRYGLITNRLKDIAIVSAVFLNALINSFVISNSLESSSFSFMELLSSFLFTLIISIIVLTYILSKNRKVNFLYKESTATKPECSLYLDYMINENTILLHNEDRTIYVIKEDQNGSAKYEVFEKV